MLKFNIGDLIQSKYSKKIFKIIPCPSNRNGFYDFYCMDERGYVHGFHRDEGYRYDLLEVSYDPNQQKDRDDDL